MTTWTRLISSPASVMSRPVLMTGLVVLALWQPAACDGGLANLCRLGMVRHPLATKLNQVNTDSDFVVGMAVKKSLLGDSHAERCAQ